MAGDAVKIVIVGSGPGAIEAALGLAQSDKLDAAVSLVTPQTEFVYRPNIVVAPFGGSSPARYDLTEILAGSGITQYQAFVERVAVDEGVVYTPEDQALEFDVLVVATGASPTDPVGGDAVVFPMPGEVERTTEIVRELSEGAIDSVAFALPDAPTWHLPGYELALGAATAGGRGNVLLISHEASALVEFGPEHSAAVQRLLSGAGVDTRFGAPVESFSGGQVLLSDGSELMVDRLISLPALRGNALDGLPSDEGGFVPVDEHQRVEGLPNVYAIGDVTNFPVKQGGLATEAADAAIAQIEADHGSRESAPPFAAELEAVLLASGDRVPLRAKIGPKGIESLPLEIDGPAQKIRSTRFGERLHKLTPLG